MSLTIIALAPAVLKPGELTVARNYHMIARPDGKPILVNGCAQLVPVFGVTVGANHPLVTAPTLGGWGRKVYTWFSLS